MVEPTFLKNIIVKLNQVQGFSGTQIGMKIKHSGLIFLKVIPERGWPWKLKTPGGIAFKPTLIYKIHEKHMNMDHFLFGIIHIGHTSIAIKARHTYITIITYVESTWFPKSRRAAFHLLIFIGVFFGLFLLRAFEVVLFL